MNKKQKLILKAITSTALFTVCYLLIDLYIGNYELVNHTLLGNYPPVYKLTIFKGIISGIFYSLTSFESVSLIIIAILTGLNLFLMINRISYLYNTSKRNIGKYHNPALKIIAGGSMLLGLATTSCTVCGFPLLTLIGLGGSIAYLPLKGKEVSLIIILLLSISAFVMIRSLQKSPSCRIPGQKKN